MTQVKQFRSIGFEEDINKWLNSHRECVIKDIKYTYDDKYGHSSALIIYEVTDEQVKK